MKTFNKNENFKQDNESGHYEEIESYTNPNKNHENVYNELNFSKTKAKNFFKSFINTRKKLFIFIVVLVSIGLICLVATILAIIFTTSNLVFPPFLRRI
jgi:hypothetical protein